MLKLLYLAERVDINIKYIASITSLMMSLSVGYPQILVSGYPDSKFTIRFSPSIISTKKNTIGLKLLQISIIVIAQLFRNPA